MRKTSKKIVLSFILFFICNVNTFAKANKTDDKLKTMKDVMEIIAWDYISETKSEKLVDGAIEGAVAALIDPYNYYMKEEEYSAFKDALAGGYTGIGLCPEVRNDRLVVVTSIPGSPAHKAGILPGDTIIKIDEKSTKGMSGNKAISLMRGEVCKKVKLTIIRSGVVDPVTFNLARKKIQSKTIIGKMLDDGIAYIKLMIFNTQSADNIRKALIDYRKQGMKSLILDLRDSPGGGYRFRCRYSKHVY